MPLVSVIIPVYNTEKYLNQCINSVLAQTLSDIEVLLIDDGSTDGSGKICDDYARKDKRIHVIHTSNHGVSHARNRGLDQAKGEYISFTDSDDWIDPDMIATLYRLMQTHHADLSTCGYIIEDENGSIIYNIKEKAIYTLNKWDTIYSLFHDKHYKYKGNLWDKLYNRNIIDNHHLRFNEKIYYNEDRLFIFQYLSYCQSLAYTSSPYYHYIMRSNSAMNLAQNIYHEKLCTFMDAFDIMTSISTSYPSAIRRAIAIDYIKSSIIFFIKYSQHIPFILLKKKLRIILKNNFSFLSLSQKTKYTLYYIKILILFYNESFKRHLLQ